MYLVMEKLIFIFRCVYICQYYASITNNNYKKDIYYLCVYIYIYICHYFITYYFSLSYHAHQIE